jgi:DNA-binding transcriptional LysR family regulator
MSIEVQDMAVFLAVVREGSFGRAAASLLISQPAVSERVVRLERIVGARLFTRGNRGATLTPAGERLLPYAQRAVDLLAEASEAVRSLEGPRRLRVAVHSTFSHRAIPIVVTALKELPRSLKFRDAHSDEIVAMLLDGVVDVGFVLPATLPRSLRFIPLPDDPVICVCGPDHPLASRASVPLRMLASTYLALNPWGSDAAKFQAELQRSGAPEWRWRECSDANTAIHLARHHDHVALITESSANDELASGTLIRLRLRPMPRWNVPLAVAYRETDRDDPAVAAIRDIARQSGGGMKTKVTRRQFQLPLSEARRPTLPL